MIDNVEIITTITGHPPDAKDHEVMTMLAKVLGIDVNDDMMLFYLVLYASSKLNQTKSQCENNNVESIKEQLRLYIQKETKPISSQIVVELLSKSWAKIMRITIMSVAITIAIIVAIVTFVLTAKLTLTSHETNILTCNLPGWTRNKDICFPPLDGIIHGYPIKP